MRLSKFLSQCKAMSRNQAKFFIRKGRVTVDGQVITDPELELLETNKVVFDREPIYLAGYRYVLLHKPASFSCTISDDKHTSVLQLISHVDHDDYFYFVNVLEANVTGLVVLSNDSRWANRIKKTLKKKTHTYHVQLSSDISDHQIEQLTCAWPTSQDYKMTPAVELHRQENGSNILTTGQVGTETIIEIFSSVGLSVETLHLKQLGKLKLGELVEGISLELSEDQIKI